MQYQNPIEAHPLYQAVAQENVRVFYALGSQQRLIMQRDAEIANLKKQLAEAEELVRQVSELPAIRKATEKAQAEAMEMLILNAAANDHAESQHAAQSVPRPRSTTVMTPSAFVAKCEAARDDEHVSSLLGEPAVPFPILRSQPSFPESQPSFPESQSTFHESQPTFHESQPTFHESQPSFHEHAGQFNLDDSSLFHDFGHFGDDAEEGFGNPADEQFGDAAEDEFGSQTVANTDSEQE
jgi:hypothetical protein